MDRSGPTALVPNAPGHAAGPPLDGSEPAPALPRPEWVGLKWLLGLRGHRVSVDRLMNDRGYAWACLRDALDSGDPALSGYAARLADRLGSA